jgi:NAD(P)-dependent dehydrogenase (short-subunit alcohol dehydrogenase family)
VQSLKGKSALLVGTRRVGAVVAERLAREGVRLSICYRRSRAEAERLRDAVAESQGPGAHPVVVVQGDLSDEADVRRLVAESADALGGLSIVVNMASDYPRAPFEELDAAAWDRGMAGAKGAFLLALHAARRMMDNPGPTRGHIVTFSDWAARETPYPSYLPYLTSKAAVEFMTRAFAVEVAESGILVNAIAPGPTMRPPEISERVWEDSVLAQAPLHRESTPEDIAEVLVGLLRTESMTGETIRVDSGRHLAG